MSDSKGGCKMNPIHASLLQTFLLYNKTQVLHKEKPNNQDSGQNKTFMTKTLHMSSVCPQGHQY